MSNIGPIVVFTKNVYPSAYNTTFSSYAIFLLFFCPLRRRIARWTLTWRRRSRCVGRRGTTSTPCIWPSSTTSTTGISRSNSRTSRTTRRRSITSAGSILTRFVITARKRSFGKVMVSVVCVCLSVHIRWHEVSSQWTEIPSFSLIYLIN